MDFFPVWQSGTYLGFAQGGGGGRRSEGAQGNPPPKPVGHTDDDDDDDEVVGLSPFATVALQTRVG